MKKLLPLVFLSSALCCSSCGLFEADNITDIKVEASISMPVGSIVLNDSSLFALTGDLSKDLKVDPQTKVLYINLEDSISLIDQARFNSIFTFGTQSFAFNAAFIPSGIPLPGGLYEITEDIRQTVSLDLPGGERLDKMVFASGSVSLSINNISGNNYSQLIVTIPQITHRQTGKALSLQVGQPVSINENYIISPVQNSTYINGFECVFTGKAPAVNSFDGRVNITLNNMQSAEGFFGRKEVQAPQITLSVTPEFEDFTNIVEYLYFADPRLVFNIRNQYNAPMIVKLDNLSLTGTRLQFKSGYENFFVAANSRAIYVLSNESTSSGKQLSQLIGTDFKNFVVNVNAVMNPSVAEVRAIQNAPASYQVPTFNSFAITDSLFGDYAVSLPFNAVMKNARFDQKIEIDLGSIVNKETTITQFAFGFMGKNYMPLDMKVQAYILDENKRKVYLFADPIIIPSSVTKNVVAATPSEIKGADMLIANIIPAKLDQMIKSKELYFEMSASTKDAASDSPVKIFSPSSIELKVLVGTTVDLNLAGKGLAPQGKVVELSNQ